MDTMFSTLLQLPLFQGLSSEDLTNILAKVKLHFTKFKEGDELALKGKECDKLIFVLNGEVVSHCEPEDNSFSVKEWLTGPFLVEPASLFGKSPLFKASYKADSKVDAIMIDKSFILNELLKYQIFSLNYLNVVSYQNQSYRERLWNNTEIDLRKRIVNLILDYVQKPIGKKSIKIKMERLADLVIATRINVSRILNQMQLEGLVELHRAEIFIPRMEKLF